MPTLEQRPYEPDWIIEHITPNGHKSPFYPLWVEGHHLDTGETFYWNVPDIEYWRHVLTPQAQEELAAIVEQARPARVAFWHRALLQVHQGIKLTMVKTPMRGWMPVCALVLLSLLLPAVAQAEPGKPCKVNVNTATPTQLQFLIRTGPVLAGEIVEVRGEGYDDLDELDRVRGIGPAWLRDNSKHVAFTGETTCTSKQTAPKPVKDGGR